MKCLLTICCALFTTAILHADDSETIIAVYDLEGVISESGQSDGNLLDFGNSPNRPLTHFDIVYSLQAAATDKNVKGVVLDLGGASISLAQLQEMRRCLLALREAGKDVWFFTPKT